jgi:hypothetical protein
MHCARKRLALVRMGDSGHPCGALGKAGTAQIRDAVLGYDDAGIAARHGDRAAQPRNDPANGPRHRGKGNDGKPPLLAGNR